MSIEQKYRFSKQKKTETLRLKSEVSQHYGPRFILVGIASSLKEYRFCYFLNKSLCLDFERKEDIVLNTTEERKEIFYSRYRAVTEYKDIEFLIFTNKFKAYQLVAEYPAFNFLLRINGEPESGYLKRVVDVIRNMEGTNYITEIDSRTIKAASLLCYELPKEEVLKPKRKRAIIL